MNSFLLYGIVHISNLYYRVALEKPCNHIDGSPTYRFGVIGGQNLTPIRAQRGIPGGSLPPPRGGSLPSPGRGGGMVFRLDALAKALSVIATATWLAGWLAGWLAVTLQYCIKTAKPIGKLF